MIFLKKMSIILSCCLIISCGANNSDILVVGTNAEFPPFEFLEDNQIVGFDIDVINAIAQELNKEIKIENLTWEGLLPALQSKKVDLIIAGMTATEDRKKIVNFSDTYYTAQEQMIILNQNNTDIKNMDDLVGNKVGVILGFTGDVIVSDIEGVQVERYNSAAQAIIDLQNQKIVALVLDSEPAKNFVANTTDLKAISGNNTQEEYSIALRKQDTELLEEINTALAMIKQNGVYQSIVQKYFPTNN